MKTELSSYIRQLESIYDGRPWYGDSLLHKLEQIGPKEAFATPAPGIHSVAQLTAHILIWRRVLVERLKGNADFKVEINSAEDWPSQKDLQKKGWEKILSELADSQRELLELLSAETDELLARTYDDKHNFRFLIEGIIQHDIYHTGQIGLLQSWLKTRQPEAEKITFSNMRDVAQNLREAVESAHPRLEALSGKVAAIKLRPEKWSVKEIIGHLVDSAANNHQRFVRAQLGATDLQPYRYAQEHWVGLQQYQSADWHALLSLWYYYNLHLAGLIATIQPEFIENELDVWDEPATLRFVAEDYVRHLKHHLDQIFNIAYPTHGFGR